MFSLCFHANQLSMTKVIRVWDPIANTPTSNFVGHTDVIRYVCCCVWFRVFNVRFRVLRQLFEVEQEWHVDGERCG